MKPARMLHHGRCHISAEQRSRNPIDAKTRQFADGAEAKIHCGLSHDAAANRVDFAFGNLSRDLLDASGDIEQVDAAFRWTWKFPVPVQARNVLAGGRAVL